MTVLLPLLRAVAVTIPLIAGANAHEGHDHGDQSKPPAQSGSTMPRVEAASGPFELVALLRHDELVIYLDRFDTNEPIAGAQISVETPTGPQDAQPKDGTYRLAAPWAKDGSVDLIFTVTEGDNTEILAGTLTNNRAGSVLSPAMSQGRNSGALVAALAALLGVVLVAWRWHRGKFLLLALLSIPLTAQDLAHAHEGHDHGTEARVPVADNSQRLPDGSLFVPKPVQRLLAIRTAVTESSTHKKTLELPGRIIPDPNASGFVQASVSGRLSAPQGGFPKLGTAVKAGDVLAFVTPPFQAIDVSDMRQKGGELDQQIAIVEKRIARYEALAMSAAVPKVTLDEAILELKGLRERRVALDKTRAESEKLIAPVAGIIASANAVAGQIAETNAVVFQIVDPARLWVEALTFSLLPDAQAATARTGEGATLALSFQGAGLSDRSQAIPVHFAIEGPPKGLRVGQLVSVMAPTGEEVQGLAVPRTSVLRSANGQTIVFEHSSPERFEPRVVRVEPLDAARVLVLDGIAAGRRVVVQGAELLNQVR